MVQGWHLWSEEGFQVKVVRQEEQCFVSAFKFQGNLIGFTGNPRLCCLFVCVFGFSSCCKATEVGGMKLGINKHDCVAMGLFLLSACQASAYLV